MSSCPRRQIQSDLTCTHGALTVESTLLVQESVKSAGWRVQRSWFAECLCDVPEFERLCDLVLSSLFIEQLVLGIAQITILVSMQVKVYTSNSVAALWHAPHRRLWLCCIRATRTEPRRLQEPTLLVFRKKWSILRILITSENLTFEPCSHPSFPQFSTFRTWGIWHDDITVVTCKNARRVDISSRIFVPTCSTCMHFVKKYWEKMGNIWKIGKHFGRRLENPWKILWNTSKIWRILNIEIGENLGTSSKTHVEAN